ncbi:hypothetical protein IJM16_01500 [Candidatus Saccharibacteria bacterium]|nr:hypothetical protein [Candidatus Saccharibacteria bacterium]
MAIRRQNRIFVVLDILLTIVMLASAAYAAVTSVVSIENEISVGAVNIELSHYRDDSGNEQEKIYQDEDIVGDSFVSSIPRIKNLGISSYIRLRVDYYDGGGNFTERATVIDLGADWAEIGDYYYLTREAVTGESLDVFKGISVPASWDDGNSQVVMIMKAEAVQAAHFNPDFTSDQPWGVITIKDFDDNYQIDSEDHTSAVTITYDDSAEKYVSVPDNFLTRLNVLVPGDSANGEITIENSDSEEHEIWMEMDIPNSSLGDTFIVTVKRGDEVIFDGTVSDLNNLSLGKYPSGSSDTITISLELPAEAGNDISGIASDINWGFRVDKKDSEPVPDAPKTGDDITTAITIFFISFIGLIIVSLFQKRGQKEER